jgi:hypothetical protein
MPSLAATSNWSRVFTSRKRALWMRWRMAESTSEAISIATRRRRRRMSPSPCRCRQPSSTASSTGSMAIAITIDRAAGLAQQLERFAHSNLHQLAGQVANLDFWLGEVDHALRTIDDYPRRFGCLRDAQMAWVKVHSTKVSGYCSICGGGCELGAQTPEPPKRIPSQRMEEARNQLRGSALRFLLRCYRAGLVDEAAVRGASDRLKLSLENEDLALSPHAGPMCP